MNKWRSHIYPDGSRKTFRVNNEVGNIHAIRKEFIDRVVHLAWVKASSHHLGTGLEFGEPDLYLIKKGISFHKRNKDYASVRALEALTCGGIPHHGVNGQVAYCHRCGEPDTAQHRLLACPMLNHHEDERVASTQQLAKSIVDGTASDICKLECWWGRGLIPNHSYLGVHTHNGRHTDCGIAAHTSKNGSVPGASANYADGS